MIKTLLVVKYSSYRKKVQNIHIEGEGFQTEYSYTAINIIAKSLACYKEYMEEHDIAFLNITWSVVILTKLRLVFH